MSEWARMAVRADARALPSSDYGSTRAIESAARLVDAAYQRGRDEVSLEAAAELRRLRDENGRLREALEFYRDQWQPNADGDIEEPHLTRTWEEPTVELWDDAGRKARNALAAIDAALAPGREGAK